MAKTKEIDLDKVEELASFGLSEQQIADSLGISRSTLSRRKKDNETFDTALRKGKGKAIVKASSALMTQIEKELSESNNLLFEVQRWMARGRA